jgi:hypothetical protein
MLTLWMRVMQGSVAAGTYLMLFTSQGQHDGFMHSELPWSLSKEERKRLLQ